MSEQLHGTEWINSHAKRSFDIYTASALLPVAAPLVAMGALAFSVETGRNPLFIQERLQKDGKSFKIAKLRTMPFNFDFADSSAGPDDQRASRVGRMLRKMTLDEAPQLLQVVAGKMSIVGPRPLIASDVEKTLDSLSLPEQSEWLRARSIAKPGLLSDFGNLSRSLTPNTVEYFRARAEQDTQYVETASALTDRRIIKDALFIGSQILERTGSIKT